ncbi:hypothetical protein D9M73_125820 [compost metagenome]
MLGDDDAIHRRIHPARLFRQIEAAGQLPRAVRGEHKRLMRRERELGLAAEMRRAPIPQIVEGDVSVSGEFEMVGRQHRLRGRRGTVEDRHRLVAAGQRLDEDLHIVGIERQHRLVAGGILVERDDPGIAEDCQHRWRGLAQVIADEQRRIRHRPERKMRPRLGPVRRIEIAGADEQHVGVVPRPRMRVERAARHAVEIVQHPRPAWRNVLAGARDIADILAPGADVSRAPQADRIEEVIIGVVALERAPDLFIQPAHRRNVATPDRFDIDQRCERAILARLHARIALWESADAAAVDLDQIEAPFLEIERDILVDMAVERDLALGERALGHIGHGRGERLPAGIAPDIRIDAGLEPHRMEPVGKGAEAGVTARPRSLGRGKGRGADDHPPVARAALEPPAIIDVDIAIALRRQP